MSRETIELLDPDIARVTHQNIKSEIDQVARVNSFVNHRISYQSDQENLQIKDRWQGVLELFSRKKGDCEDYAIAKYSLLRDAGVPAKNLRITYVITTLNGISEPHMVLVYLPNGKEANAYVLDNMMKNDFDKKLVPLKDRNDLKVKYSFDEEKMYDGVSQKTLGKTEDLGLLNVANENDRRIANFLKNLFKLNLSAKEMDERLHSFLKECLYEETVLY